jgi:hypothetical protein
MEVPSVGPVIPSRNRVIWLMACAVTALWMGGAAEAHHSGTRFAPGCPNIEGTVRTLEWVYPHAWLWIIVAGNNASAEDNVWGFEFPSPTQTMNLDKRWSRDVVKKGDKVTVTYNPMKGGRHGGLMHSVTLSDGRVLVGAPGRCDQPPGAGTVEK